MLFVWLAGCSGNGMADLEPAAPTSGNLPVSPIIETPEAAETQASEPTEPANVEMREPADPITVEEEWEVEPATGDRSEAGDPTQVEEERDMVGAGQEAPAPDMRDPLARLVEQARQILAERISVADGEVSVTSTEDVAWSDSSLGCPDPERMYAQVITPGYRIVLEAGGETYTFHASEQGELVLCGADGTPER
jgi:hypothetical protein